MRSRKDRAMSDFAESDFADDPRAALDRLLRERRIDYAELSARIDRNPAYIQQYIKRGSPRRLAEEDRRSEEHTSELQSLMRISYAVLCLKKKNKKNTTTHYRTI